MARLRPFDSEAALFEAAERIWWGLAPADWLEAFAAHPKIGDRDAIRAKFAATAAWSAREQAGIEGASEDVLQELAEANVRYEERFGYHLHRLRDRQDGRGDARPAQAIGFPTIPTSRSRSPPPSRRRSRGFAWRKSPHEPDHDSRPGHRHRQARAGGRREPGNRQRTGFGPLDRAGPRRHRRRRPDRQFDPPLAALKPGVYRIRFDTGAYFTAMGVHAFYPEVHVVVQIDDPAQHFHIPLLLSPFGYTTYRGS